MANERARALRRNQTSAEKRLWSRLRQLKAQGYKFRRQVPIDRFIVDFACLSERLIIEIDGGTHSTDEERRKDAEREAYLESQGFRVVRFWNGDVFENLNGVMDSIMATLPPPPTPPRRGGGGL